MSKRPVIVLNMSLDIGKKYERYDLRVPVSYVDAVADAGGIPLCLPTLKESNTIRPLLRMSHGVVLIGGDDYRPEHYGGRPQPESELMPGRRSRFDLDMASWILKETALPVLGICGGHQLICIALGGRLIQDIRTEWTTPGGAPPLPHAGRERFGQQKSRFRHDVRMTPDSLIARVTGMNQGEPVSTNSRHHQAVHPDRPGLGLRATAWAQDGVIEALEPATDSPWAASGRFILGVQWHPENLQNEEPHRNIFLAFIQAAQRQRKRSK